MINRRFFYYKTRAAFERDKSLVPNEAIVFIEDERIIWTHGLEYGKCSINHQLDNTGQGDTNQGNNNQGDNQGSNQGDNQNQGGNTDNNDNPGLNDDPNLNNNPSQGCGININNGIINVRVYDSTLAFNTDLSIYTIVDELPTNIDNIDINKIYVVRQDDSQGVSYLSYVYDNGQFRDISNIINTLSLNRAYTYIDDRFDELVQLIGSQELPEPVNKMITLTVEQYQLLITSDEVQEGTYYFTYESEEEPEQSSTWVFGGTFPITFSDTWTFGDTFPIILTEGSTSNSIGTFPITLT